MESYRGGVSPSAVSREASAHGSSRATNGAASAFCAGVKPTLLGFAAFALAAAAAVGARADVANGTVFTWTSTTGGDMADGANWNQNGESPVDWPNTRFTIAKEQSAPVTLSQSLVMTNNSASTSYANNFGASVELKFDAADVALTTHVIAVGVGKSVSLTRGCITNTIEFGMGYNKTTGATFTVDGAEAALVCRGSRGLCLGHGNGGVDNALVVTNGGTLVVSGTTTIGNGPKAKNNALVVTGEGSSASLGMLWLGRGGDGSGRVEVLDGGTVSIAPGSSAAYIFFASATSQWATNALIHASGAGSMFSSSSYPRVYGCKNVLRASDGGTISGSWSLYGVSNEVQVANGTVKGAFTHVERNGSTYSEKSNANKGVGSAISFSGAAPKFEISGGTLFGDATLRFDVPAEGWATAPMTLTDKAAFTLGETKIDVTVPREAGNMTVPLVYAKNGFQMNEGQLAAWTAAVNPGHGKTGKLVLSADGKTLSCKIDEQAGTTIVIR